MQLELALTDRPVVGPTLWEQLDPAVREAVIDRLAQAIAAAGAAMANPPEDNHHE